jgi:3-isopropylmalate dehydrogenase
MGDPDIRYPDGTEITPQIDLRFEFELYAGIRPVRSIPGVPGPLADARASNIDFVLVRESIEGLFEPNAKGTLVDDTRATETLVITRDVSQKLFKTSCELWQKRRRLKRGCNRLTCIDKANVFQAFVFFRSIFYEVAKQYEAPADHVYVDAMAMHLVTRPWDFDVMVTENMFGDILSDQAAALIGGMGYAPSADIGEHHAVFQPCHGTAPDIAGKGMANPTAMFLSAAMLLDWLADKHHDERARDAAQRLESAVFSAFSSCKLRTCELGGDSGLDDVTHAVEAALKKNTSV